MNRTTWIPILVTALGPALIAMTLPLPAHAGYRVTGQITGIVCTGIVIKSCGERDIVAVKGKDGGLYELARHYDSVTKYNPKRGRCTIEIQGASKDIITRLGKSLTTPTFYERVGGDLREIKVDRLLFPCAPT